MCNEDEVRKVGLQREYGRRLVKFDVQSGGVVYRPNLVPNLSMVWGQRVPFGKPVGGKTTQTTVTNLHTPVDSLRAAPTIIHVYLESSLPVSG